MAAPKKVTTTFRTWREMNPVEKQAVDRMAADFEAKTGRAPREHEIMGWPPVQKFHDRVLNDAFRELLKAGGSRGNGIHANLLNRHVMQFSVWHTTGWKGDWNVPPSQRPADQWRQRDT